MTLIGGLFPESQALLAMISLSVDLRHATCELRGSAFATSGPRVIDTFG